MLDNISSEHGYAAWGERLVTEGWTPYFLTFMFQPIGGSAAHVAEVMEAEVVRVYSTFLPWVVRHPTRASSRGRHPVWFCAPDYPVYKRQKSSRLDAFVNDGAHVHAAAFQPPISRFHDDLATHFEAYRELYLRSDHALDRIDVEPITSNVGDVVRYGLKAIKNGRAGKDAMLILPRSLSEMR